MVSKSQPRYIPDRGDIVWLNFIPQSGREQSGRRPALVLSPKAYNGKASLAICCPITSKSKGYPFEVAIIDAKKISGVVLADQVKSLDWAERKALFIEKASSNIIAETLGKLQVLLD